MRRTLGPRTLYRTAVIWLSLVNACMAGADTDTLSGYTMPPGVTDPEVAIKHWSYSDPVFLWRLTSKPKNIFEPEDYFYWPDAVIGGNPQPFFPPAKQQTIKQETLDEIASWAQAHKSNALIVIHKGQLLLERYWNGLTPDKIVNGRAITRSMAPMLLGFAIADGTVAFDDPIGKFIHEWADDPRGKITVRQLAQNVSGLELPALMPPEQVYGNKLMCLAYCGDVVRAALEHELTRTPGAVFEVADENMQILGTVIARALETPLEDLLSERVWKRIGASDATFQRDRPGGVARVMCCMRATARDYSRLGVLIAQNGVWNGQQVLPKGWVETMARPSEQNANFGIGLWLGSPYVPMRRYYPERKGAVPASEPYLVDDVRIMEGGGYRVIYASPSQELVIFRHGVGVPDWDGAYLINTAIKGIIAQ